MTPADLHPPPALVQVRDRRPKEGVTVIPVGPRKVKSVRIWIDANGRVHVITGIESVYDFVPPFNREGGK